MDESEKTAKSIHHLRMKVKIYQKRSLSVDEMQKTRKTARHPWMKAKKRRKAESTKIIPDFAQTLWYQESTLTERTLNRELPTNVHTLIFQHTADVFLRVKFDSTGFNFSNNTRQMFFCVLIMVRAVGIMLCFHAYGRMFGVTIAMLTCKGSVEKVTCVNLYARFVGKYL